MYVKQYVCMKRNCTSPKVCKILLKKFSALALVQERR